MDKIVIKDKEYQVGRLKTLKAMLYFEQVTSKPFELKTMSDLYIYFFLCLASTNEDNNLQWEDFLDYMQDNPNTINYLLDKQALEDKFDGALVQEVVDTNTKTKKKSQSKK